MSQVLILLLRLPGFLALPGTATIPSFEPLSPSAHDSTTLQENLALPLGNWLYKGTVVGKPNDDHYFFYPRS